MKHAATSPAGAGEVFPFVNRWRRIPLPGDLHAIARIDPAGIQPPAKGDGLEATASIALPAEGQAIYPDIAPEFRFGAKAALFGNGCSEHFQRGWNWKEHCPCRDTLPPGYVATWATFTGATWREALRSAEEGIIAEISNLRAALLAREAALASEGCEYYRAAKLAESKEPPRLIPAYEPAWPEPNGTETED